MASNIFLENDYVEYVVRVGIQVDKIRELAEAEKVSLDEDFDITVDQMGQELVAMIREESAYRPEEAEIFDIELVSVVSR